MFVKILVTGANGYLGQGIVKRLIESGNEVIATDIKTDRVDKRATIIASDIFNLEDPYNALGQPDHLLHLAWRDGFAHYSNSHIDDLPKHYHFVKSFIRPEVKMISIMGTMHEVGAYEGCIDEFTRCNPVTPYGIAKNCLRMLSEALCRQSETKLQWLRAFYIVGNTKYGASIFSKIYSAESNGETVFPFTSGQNQYDFIDYDVFCDQVAQAVIQDTILGIINICSGYPEKLSSRVERFIKKNGFKIKLDYGAYPDRPYDSKAVWGDNKKIKEIMSNHDIFKSQSNLD